MKTAAIHIAVTLAAIAVCYGMAVFVSFEPDVSKWGMGPRGIFVFVCIVYVGLANISAWDWMARK